MAEGTREGLGGKGSRKVPHKMQKQMLKKEQCLANEGEWGSRQKRQAVQRNRESRIGGWALPIEPWARQSGFEAGAGDVRTPFSSVPMSVKWC